MTPDTPLPARARTFVAQHLAALAPLPCRVEAMTAQEYAIYQALIPAVAALETLAGWGDAAPAAQEHAMITDTTHPTPGQICYTAWWVTFGDDPPLADAYQALTPRARRAWEAAAQAVLAWQAQGVDGTGFAPPGLHRQPPQKEMP